jgi:hypothetical protein
MIFTLLDCLHSHGQEFGPPKTATEKHGNHGAVGAKSLVLSLHHCLCKVAFKVVLPKNSQPTTQPTVWYVLYDLRGDQETRRQDSVDQVVLCQAFGLRCRLQVFVGDVKVAVPQVVADGELMFARFRQHGSDRACDLHPSRAAEIRDRPSGADPHRG